MAPLFARRLRQALEQGLDERFGRFAWAIARLRATLRGLGKDERRDAVQHALNGFAIEVRVSYPAEEGRAPIGDLDGRAHRHSDVVKP